MAEMWELFDIDRNKLGRLHERGKPLQKGEYHLGAHVWILNSNNEFLLTRRSEGGGHKWHTTGGSAVAGDDGLTTALKEADEEIGIKLDPAKGKLFTNFVQTHDDDRGFHVEVWLFQQDINIDDVVLQTEEVIDVMWADAAGINQMVSDGRFVDPSDWYPYLDELLYFCEEQQRGQY